METKVCLECGREKPIGHFGSKHNVQIQKSGKTVIRRSNLCQACYSARSNARLKVLMLDAFDWKCQCCGERHPDFLALQHVTGKGRVTGQRASVKERWFAKRHGWDKEHFSVLCYNCNCARQYFGTCPHEKLETADDGIARLRRKGEPKRYFVSKRWKWLDLLTPEKVLEIKSLKESGRNASDVGRQVGIDHRIVGEIWAGKRFKEIEVA